MKKLQTIFLSNAKFFAIILFRSKAQLILRNRKKHVFAGFHSTTIVLIADKHFSLFFLTKLKDKPPNLQIYYYCYYWAAVQANVLSLGRVTYTLRRPRLGPLQL